jgi:putative glutamine amidotransferase
VTHSVRTEKGSLVAHLLGRRSAKVNSFHHQAVKRLGRGLAAVAWASDGVIEAVEAPARGFVVGVQWHAECLTERPEHAALFEGLVAATASFSGAAVAARAA